MIFAVTKNVAVWMLWALALSGCASQERDENLAASIRPAASSEESITGERLRSCFEDGPRIQSMLTPDSVALYNEDATYKLAGLMKRSPNDIPHYASFVRGYVFPYVHTSIFGTKEFTAICYFGDPGSGTRFAAVIVADSLGRVRKSDMTGAVVDAYKNLSGKTLSFPEQTALIMSIPR